MLFRIWSPLICTFLLDRNIFMIAMSDLGTNSDCTSKYCTESINGHYNIASSHLDKKVSFIRVARQWDRKFGKEVLLHVHVGDKCSTSD